MLPSGPTSSVLSPQGLRAPLVPSLTTPGGHNDPAFGTATRPTILTAGSSPTDTMMSEPVKPKKKKPSGAVHFAAGGIGGMAGAIVTGPLEVVKTRMQSSLYTHNSRHDLKRNGPPMPPVAPTVVYPRPTPPSSSPSSTPPPSSSSHHGAGSSHAASPSTLSPGNAVRLSQPGQQGLGQVYVGATSSFHSTSGTLAVDSGATITFKTAEPRTVLLRPLRFAVELFTKPVEMIGHIYRTEGLTALWKGLGPNLAGIIPARAIYFGTYAQGKHFFTELADGQESSLVHLAAAAVAGVTVATVTCPIWVVKTRMQLQSSAGKHGKEGVRYKNSFDCVKKVIIEEGAKGLYKGLGASYLGVIESTLQFVLYEKLKQVTREHRAKHPTSLLYPRVQEWMDYFSLAAVSKLAAALITYPHEVVRTRMREAPIPGQPFKYRSIMQTVKVIRREEGAAPFYGGLGAHLLRVVPNAAIMFLGYELVVNFFDS